MCTHEEVIGVHKHRAFCLADLLPCVAERSGVLEVATDRAGGISAIMLTADPLGRLWTTVPNSIPLFAP